MSIEFILLLVGGYLLGSIPAAYLAAKWARGVDIRQYGSGNVGAANLFKLTHKWVGVVVSVFDLVKGMPLVCVAHFLGLGIGEQAAIGLAAIAGHNWPVFLRFSGGRGMMTTLGVAFILPLTNLMVPWETIIAVAICFIGAYAIHNVPLGVGTAVAVSPLVSWIFGRPLEMTLGFLAIVLIMVIRRLTVPKTSVTDSVPTGELLLNRLLFDRDIRDRDAWVHRKPVPPKEKTKKD